MKYANKVFWSIVATLFIAALGVPLPIAVVLGIICGNCCWRDDPTLETT